MSHHEIGHRSRSLDPSRACTGTRRRLANRVQHRNLRSHADAVVVHDGEGVLAHEPVGVVDRQGVSVADGPTVGLHPVQVDALGMGLGALHVAGDPLMVEGDVKGYPLGALDLH